VEVEAGRTCEESRRLKLITAEPRPLRAVRVFYRIRVIGSEDARGHAAQQERVHGRRQRFAEPRLQLKMQPAGRPL
jgi:hypothetical protein